MAEHMQNPVLDGVLTCLLLQKGGMEAELPSAGCPFAVPAHSHIGSWEPRGLLGVSGDGVYLEICCGLPQLRWGREGEW